MKHGLLFPQHLALGVAHVRCSVSGRGTAASASDQREAVAVAGAGAALIRKYRQCDIQPV